MERAHRLREEFQKLRLEAQQRQDALILELEDALRSARQIQKEVEVSNAELEATNARLRTSMAEREAVKEKLARSEAAAREVLETAAQAILAVSPSGKIVRANEMAHTMFGYPRGNLLGRMVGTLVPHGLRTAHKRHMDVFFDSPQRRPMGAGRDLMGERMDGTRFPVEVGLSSIAGDEGPLAVAFISDITERKRAEREIVESRERLRRLATRLITASEDETRKWARELHDVYTQRLVAIAMEVDRMARPEGGPPDAETVEATRALGSRVRLLADDVHRMARRMHPAILSDLGLVAALRSELSSFQKQHGVRATLDAGNIRADVSRDAALCCYRIAQEALNNIRKHADTDRLKVKLSEAEGVLTMVVRDEGRGFDPRAIRQRGLGLLSMEERAQGIGGAVSIESRPGKGTAVHVHIPLGDQGAAEGTDSPDGSGARRQNP